jgi:MauM/NapG family ferredoxin protein
MMVLFMMKISRNTGISRPSIGRRLVQFGFLLLFLFPWLPVIYSRVYGKDTPVFTSWLLPFDVLLNTAKALHGDLLWVIPGTVLFILTFSFVFGRAFCGWICPLGTLLDWIRSLAFWQKGNQKHPSTRNSRIRFSILAGVIAASFVSIQFLGWFDPLIIFNRAASAIISNLLLADSISLRLLPFSISILFLAIIALETIRPRFWCRNLCPFGALISLPAHFSLLNRQVTNACSYCGNCRKVCPMNAICAEPHETRYSDCTFCLDCESICPNQGIQFGFGQLALSKWQRKERQTAPTTKSIPQGSYCQPKYLSAIRISRRQVLESLTVGAAGLAAAPFIAKTQIAPGLIRPPGALPEVQFTQTCVTCQECIRVCPSRALRPALLEGGLASIGTPYLAPRQGACSFNPSCPQLCAQVCPVGAIRSIPVAKMRTGVAKVDHSACLAWDQGVKCLVCVEACLSDAAKSLNGKIIVDAAKCTGCGRCESGCPVAGSAIRVVPV